MNTSSRYSTFESRKCRAGTDVRPAAEGEVVFRAGAVESELVGGDISFIAICGGKTEADLGAGRDRDIVDRDVREAIAHQYVDRRVMSE